MDVAYGNSGTLSANLLEKRKEVKHVIFWRRNERFEDEEWYWS